MHTVTEFDQGRGLREDLDVYSADGQRLGRIVALGEDTFLIEKGHFYKENHVARFDQIAGRRDDGAVVLRVTADELPPEIFGTDVHTGEPTRP
jgi:hypothetical protein